MNINQIKLENGMEILGVHVENIGLVYPMLVVESGGIYYAPAGVPRGTPHMLEHVLANGLGGKMNFDVEASTFKKRIGFKPAYYILSEELEEYLKLLADLFTKEINEETLEYERGRVLDESKMIHKEKGAEEKIRDILFGETEFNDPLLNMGEVEEILSITLEDILKFRELYFGANRARLEIVGDYDIEKIKEIFEEVPEAKRDDIIKYPKLKTRSGRFTVEDEERKKNSIYILWPYEKSKSLEITIIRSILHEKLQSVPNHYYILAKKEEIYEQPFLIAEAYMDEDEFDRFVKITEIFLKGIAEGKIKRKVFEKMERSIVLQERIVESNLLEHANERMNYLTEGRDYEEEVEKLKNLKKEDIEKTAEELLNGDKIIIEVKKNENIQN